MFSIATTSVGRQFINGGFFEYTDDLFFDRSKRITDRADLQLLAVVGSLARCQQNWTIDRFNDINDRDAVWPAGQTASRSLSGLRQQEALSDQTLQDLRHQFRRDVVGSGDFRCAVGVLVMQSQVLERNESVICPFR
jgi:hypothetical protein